MGYHYQLHFIVEIAIKPLCLHPIVIHLRASSISIISLWIRQSSTALLRLNETVVAIILYNVLAYFLCILVEQQLLVLQGLNEV